MTRRIGNTYSPTEAAYDILVDGTDVGMRFRGQGTGNAIEVVSGGSVILWQLSAKGIIGGTNAPMLNVRSSEYAGGAIGDGVADDTAAIQACLNTAAIIGAIVHFPPGTYLIFGTLTITGDNVVLRGTPVSQIKLAPGIVSATIRHMLYVQGNNFLCENLTFDQQQSTQTPTNFSEIIQLGQENASGSVGVTAGTRYSNLRVRNCRFLNGVSGHIRVFKCSNVWITDNYCFGVSANTGIAVSNIKFGWVFDGVARGNYCDFGTQRTTGNNIFATHTGNSSSGSERILIEGNTALNCTDSPIEMSSSTSGSGLAAICQNGIIANNIVRLGAGIISTGTRGMQIVNNKIIAPGGGAGNAWGIRLGCLTASNTTVLQENVLVSGNQVVGDANTTRGIYATAQGGIMRRLSIIGNHVVDITGTGGLGINIDGSSVASPNHSTDIIVAGNQVLNCTTALYSLIGLDATALVTLDGVGAGVPAYNASQGSTWRRTDGGAATSFYVKETAVSSAIWAAK